MIPKRVEFSGKRVAGYVLKTTMKEIHEANPIPAFWDEIFKDGRHAQLKNANQ
jgi:predicted transcriptional regulator YdeE